MAEPTDHAVPALKAASGIVAEALEAKDLLLAIYGLHKLDDLVAHLTESVLVTCLGEMDDETLMERSFAKGDEWQRRLQEKMT